VTRSPSFTSSSSSTPLLKKLRPICWDGTTVPDADTDASTVPVDTSTVGGFALADAFGPTAV
jgi:hypothetical protein